jgi:membrane protease YdiL (CAAX protease family)
MTDRSTTTPNPAGIRAFVARRPVAAFLIMAFAIAYAVMSLVALAVHRVIPGGPLLERLPVPPDETVGLMLTMFALLPSALFVTWAADGRAGVVSLFNRIARWRFGVGWWLAVLAGLPVLTVVFTLILGGSLESIEPSKLLWDQLRLLLINFILVNLWEETAWAGVMQTRLERRHNIFVAAALTAIPFGFIHLPLAFLSEITIASVLISLAAYILLGLFLGLGRSRPQRLSRQPACRRPDTQRLQPHQQRQRHRRGLAQRGALPARDPDRGGRTHRRAGTAGRAPTAQQGLPAGT